VNWVQLWSFRTNESVEKVLELQLFQSLAAEETALDMLVGPGRVEHIQVMCPTDEVLGVCPYPLWPIVHKKTPDLV
jgi:hypothetical protein